jgi:hypothetical protein
MGVRSDPAEPAPSCGRACICDQSTGLDSLFNTRAKRWRPRSATRPAAKHHPVSFRCCNNIREHDRPSLRDHVHTLSRMVQAAKKHKRLFASFSSEKEDSS